MATEIRTPQHLTNQTLSSTWVSRLDPLYMHVQAISESAPKLVTHFPWQWLPSYLMSKVDLLTISGWEDELITTWLPICIVYGVHNIICSLDGFNKTKRYIDCAHIPFTTGSATEAGDDQELTPNECEEHIPELNDILKASFASVRDLVHCLSCKQSAWVFTHFPEIVQ